MDTYAGTYPQPGAAVATGWHAGEAAGQVLCMQDVADIEEAIWAPRHGLKGMIDASVQAVVQPATACSQV